MIIFADVTQVLGATCVMVGKSNRTILYTTKPVNANRKIAEKVHALISIHKNSAA